MDKVTLSILLILCALSFLFNATFLLIVRKSWTLVKRRRITYHVTNLAFSDSMVGANSFCMLILMVVAGRETTLRLAFDKIRCMSILTSLQAVCLMAVERAVCLQKPHTWHQFLPLKRILLVMAGNWVFALQLVILMHFYRQIMVFVFLILFSISLSLTSVLYVNMYLKIKKSNKVHDEVVQEGSSAAAAIEERRNNLMQRKVGNFVLSLTLLLLITMLPSIIATDIQVSCQLFKLNCGHMEALQKVTNILYLLSIINFIVNPIIYVWKMSMYRQALWKMFGKTVGNNSRLNPSGTYTE